MNIMLFGKLADRLGREIQADVPSEGCSIVELRAALARRYPDFAEEFSSARNRACVDQAIVPDSMIVTPGQEIAFIPPLSGG